jgi:hypothetical protein
LIEAGIFPVAERALVVAWAADVQQTLVPSVNIKTN